MIGVARTIEDNLSDAESLGLLSDIGADLLGSVDIGRILQAKLGGGGRSERNRLVIIDESRVDELVGAVDGDSRAGRGSADLSADPDVTMESLLVSVECRVHVSSPLLLGSRRLLGRSRLTENNNLVDVADALAMVDFRLADVADDSGLLTDELLVDTFDIDEDAVLGIDGDGDALHRMDNILVGVSDEEDQVIASHRSAVTDTADLESLLEALGDADDHIVDIGSGGTVDHLHRDGVIGALDLDLALDLLDREVLVDFGGKLALGSLDRDSVALDGDSDTSRDRNR